MVLWMNNLRKPSILPKFMNLDKRLIMIIEFQNKIHMPVSVLKNTLNNKCMNILLLPDRYIILVF